MKYPGSPERIMELLGTIRLIAAGLEGESAHELRTLFAELAEEIAQTPYAKLSPGEPFFFVRGQDALFPRVVLDYAEAFLELGGDISGYGEILHLAGRGMAWHSGHETLVKVAD